MRHGFDTIHRFSAQRIVAVYALIGGLWIYSSDSVMAWIIQDPALMTRISVYKGFLFISLTASLLYFMINRHVSRLSEYTSRIRTSEERFSTIYNNISDAVFIFEADTGKVVDINQTACGMFGYTREEALRLTIDDLDAPCSQAEARKRLRDAERVGVQGFDWLCRNKDGSSFWTEVGLHKVPLDGHDLVVGAVRDITSRKETEKQLRLLAQVFEHSGEAIVITDSDNSIIATNGTFSRLTGYSQAEALGENPKILKSGKEQQEFYVSMWEELLARNFWQGEIWDRRKDGSLYPKWLNISIVRNEQGEIVNYIGRFSDITERKLAEQRIEHLAHHDTLTNLANRNSLNERFFQALEQAKRSLCHMGIMFIDLDRFKTINDSLGHHVGDMLLFEVAARLKEAVRSCDIVARLGGDEFVVVLPQINSTIEAAHIADKILQTISGTYTLNGYELHATPSIGISIYPHDGDTTATLMQHADAAMYHAKAQGRNNYQFFTREMHDAAHERLVLENDLRLAIERDEFVLHYQPQIDVSSGQVVAVEALVRWQHPERGLIPPDTFIPIAEESGLILQMGHRILELACSQLAAWISQELPPIRMAVNLSVRQFRQKQLPEIVAAIIAGTGIAPHLLELEITESAAMEHPEETIRTLTSLREMGVELSIDDFGTGYSSLSYLKLFPVNRLKIDRSFVKDIGTDANDAAIAAATIALAHTLGKDVIAEGVETEGQFAFLKHQQCDHVQGYLFSRPLPPAGAWDFFTLNGLPDPDAV